MDRIEIARKYFAENQKPIQDLCPEVVQYWNSASGTVYWSNKTGKRCYGYEKKNGSFLVSTSKREHYGLYVRYVDDLNALEISRILLSTNGRGIDGFKVGWDFDNYYRYLCFRDDVNAYSAKFGFVPGGKYYCKDVCSCISGIGGCYEYNIPFETELSQFRQEWSDVHSRYQFLNAYKRTWVNRNTSKKMQEIESIELDTPQFEYDESTNAYLYCELVDEYAVLRLFKMNEKWDPIKREYIYITPLKEETRIFVDKKGNPTCYTNNYKRWQMTPKTQIAGWSSRSMRVVNPEIMQEWPALKYVYPIIEWNNTNDIEKLVQILRHPIVEQLSKAGYPSLARDILLNNTVASNLDTYFMAKEKKVPMYKMLGVNKYILAEANKISSEFDRRYGNTCALSIIQKIKELYDRFDISDLSKETVEFLFQNLGQMGYLKVFDLVGKHRSYWNRHEEFHITEDERKFILKLFRINQRTAGTNVITYYHDVRAMYDGMINKPDIDLTDFEDYGDIQRIHDALVALINIENANREAARIAARKKELEEQKKKFVKLQDERVKKYEKDGEKFCIRVPHDLEEITKEGNVLHHCVGSYLNRHAEGYTNIIFLRRKDAENDPFYTIEVCNDSVVQIHGSHNRWLGNDPEAIPFVYQWLTERGIKFKKEHLLNKGAGYGASMENLPESYLYSA